MSIGVIAVTHKEAAQSLLDSAEMIFGKQENVKAVPFFENEDGQMLKIKLEEAVGELNSEDGVLFLVDLFGGTPFNASFMIAQKSHAAEIVTGLNLPMLVEALMSKGTMDLLSLAETIKKAGIDGIRSGKAERQNGDDE